MSARGTLRESEPAAARARFDVEIRGAVQGVGFRPFIYRLATGLGLSGWVANSPRGVAVEVEGPRPALDAFLARVRAEAPPRARVQEVSAVAHDPSGLAGFVIRESELAGPKAANLLPDAAVCPDCLREVFDPADRRYLYPFANCTQCGPRYTIVEGLPYDRDRTTMKRFTMCRRCRAEYEDPANRRFHAQPNACPECGPRLAWWDAGGARRAGGHDALLVAAQALRAGRIVAVKGLGGFHLVVDARDGEAVSRLRSRKRRPTKPFAVMFPSLDAVRAACEVSPLEAALLASPETPIVLLARWEGGGDGPERIADPVAPGSPLLGAFLPYTPLHHILLREAGAPLVATSGNLAEEPICTDEEEARERLRGIADGFLVHDRPIARPVDDSVVRVVLGDTMILRRARGYAPLPLPLPRPAPSILAVGGHMKNTVALTAGDQVFLSQHVGDLETERAARAFRAAIADLERIYDLSPSCAACDLHPDYLSSRHAAEEGVPVAGVQHHHAHVVSCLVDNRLDGTVLGVSWDGTGYGTDGTIWGGEFLVASAAAYRRAAHLRTFRLPGGSLAVREPRRVALGLLYEAFGEEAAAMSDLPPIAAFADRELSVLVASLRARLCAPVTSSAGRLFDAVAALLGLLQVATFEGEAAMALEHAARGAARAEPYPFRLAASSRGGVPGPRIVDWEPALRAIIEEIRGGARPAAVATRFHATLAETVLSVAREIREPRVALSGGCFQNPLLLERTVERLRAEGFHPFWHRSVPPNDGGLAVGQAAVAASGGLCG